MLMRVFIPDLPDVEALTPWLQRMAAARYYSNFGPLEREFAAALGRHLDAVRPPPVATASSATTALTLALRALDLPAKARVLIPALTFPGTAAAVLDAGLAPVLCDVDGASWLLTPAIARGLRGQFDAVVPVSAYGLALDVAAWDAFVRETGLPVVFDAAAALIRQAMPEVCVATFSLHATKPLGVGEGGLVASRDANLVARVRQLSNFGFDNDLVVAASGNSKLSEWHAAVGLAQLARIDEIRQRLARVHGAYMRRLPTHVRPPGEASLMVIRLPGRAVAAAEALAKAGIETRRWYQPDLTGHPAFDDLPRAGDLPVTRAMSDQLLGLPFHGHLQEADIDKVTEALAPWLADAPSG
jgi:dTDP-4-amino-4,6-dideoxygalactose transaminase